MPGGRRHLARGPSRFDNPPPMCIDPAKTYTATVDTSEGSFTVDPRRRQGAADGQQLRRAVPLPLLRRACRSTGSSTASSSRAAIRPAPVGGGPGYKFADELPRAGGATSGLGGHGQLRAPNTNGSQFFVITGDTGSTCRPTTRSSARSREGFDTTVKALEAAADADAASNGGPTPEPVYIERHHHGGVSGQRPRGGRRGRPGAGHGRRWRRPWLASPSASRMAALARLQRQT